MPTIPFVIITSDGPKATTVTCSQELYDEAIMGGYINEHLLFEHSVSANYFKEYLKTKRIAYVEIELPHVVITEKGGEISIYKDAVNLPVYNVRTILESRELSYEDFIDSYCEVLKSIKPKIRRPLSGK